MRVSDYRRMGKISLKARKKSTKNTVRGICFGLILLIPIVFFTLAFFIGLTGTINETRTISCFELPGKNIYDNTAKNALRPFVVDSGNYVYTEYQGIASLDNKTLKSLTTQDGMEERVVGEYYCFGSENYSDSEKKPLTVSIGGIIKNIDTYFTQKSGNGNRVPHQLKAVNLSESAAVVTKAEVEELNKTNKKVLAAGDLFTNENLGKGEMIVGEPFLNAVGFYGEASEYVGKNISITYNLSQNNKANYLSKNLAIFENGEDIFSGMDWQRTVPFKIIKDFKIVGVLSEDYYKLSSTINESHLIISSASVYDDDGEFIGGEISLSSVESGNNTEQQVVRVDYENVADAEAKAAEEKRMFVALGIVGFSSYHRDSNYISGDLIEADLLRYCPQSIKVQGKSYEAVSKMSAKINAEFSSINPRFDNMDTAISLYSTSEYSSFTMLNTIGNYLMLVLYSFGGIIFFATLLNLYNTINYSVQVRKNYIGVMRAIGAKQKVIPKIYFYEIVLIFLKSLPWVLIFAGGISFGIKWGIDSMFKMMATVFGVAIKLNFLYFFITLAAVVLLVFFIAFLFSQIACWNASRRPILEVLSDDKG